MQVRMATGGVPMTERYFEQERPPESAADDLEARRMQARADLDDARNRITQLQRHAADAEERVRLIEKLIALEAGVETQAPSRDDLLSAVEAIIRAAARPVGLRELRDALLERGIPLPGQGLDANLIARINRSGGRIVRVKRGMYDLPPGGTDAKSPQST
jgi:hypothetical protein